MMSRTSFLIVIEPSALVLHFLVMFFHSLLSFSYLQLLLRFNMQSSSFLQPRFLHPTYQTIWDHVSMSISKSIQFATKNMILRRNGPLWYRLNPHQYLLLQVFLKHWQDCAFKNFNNKLLPPID